MEIVKYLKKGAETKHPSKVKSRCSRAGDRKTELTVDIAVVILIICSVLAGYVALNLISSGPDNRGKHLKKKQSFSCRQKVSWTQRNNALRIQPLAYQALTHVPHVT